MEKKQADIIAVKSDMALKINEVLLSQNTINQLHHKLEGAKEREKELEQQIATGHWKNF